MKILILEGAPLCRVFFDRAAILLSVGGLGAFE
jgi:hypothetical protein